VSGLVIDEDRFVLTESHPSWIDAMAKLRAQTSSKGVSLDQCIETFVKPERLEEQNMCYCSNCQELVRAMKTM
jgi:ubiquitin carboxyl-terminal hydrolase 4/11/15